MPDIKEIALRAYACRNNKEAWASICDLTTGCGLPRPEREAVKKAAWAELKALRKAIRETRNSSAGNAIRAAFRMDEQTNG